MVGPPVLQHMLDDIVAVLVLHKVVDVQHQLLQDGPRLRVRTVLQNALDDAAAVCVRRQREHLSRKRIQDELDELAGHLLDALLDDVVAVLVLHARHNVSVQLLDQQRLLVAVNHLQRLRKCQTNNDTAGRTGGTHLLDDAASVHLHGERHDVANKLLRKTALLLRAAVLKELLDDIVAKDVGHQRERLGQDLVKDHLLVGIQGNLQLLLDEARAVLVHAELHNVMLDIL